MKASAFSYARATSVVNALELLVAHGDGAKVLSGGQSLMPAMNLRLIAPELIVDIGGLAELRGVAVSGDVLRVGALTRHIDLLRSPEIAAHADVICDDFCACQRRGSRCCCGAAAERRGNGRMPRRLVRRHAVATASKPADATRQ